MVFGQRSTVHSTCVGLGGWQPINSEMVFGQRSTVHSTCVGLGGWQPILRWFLVKDLLFIVHVLV